MGGRREGGDRREGGGREEAATGGRDLTFPFPWCTTQLSVLRLGFHFRFHLNQRLYSF